MSSIVYMGLSQGFEETHMHAHTHTPSTGFMNPSCAILAQAPAIPEEGGRGGGEGRKRGEEERGGEGGEGEEREEERGRRGRRRGGGEGEERGRRGGNRHGRMCYSHTAAERCRTVLALLARVQCGTAPCATTGFLLGIAVLMLSYIEK